MAPLRDIKRLPGDDSGAILVFWGIAVAIVLGIVALSFDFGRIAATQSELQSFADHVALAAAGELDGRSDSITRAQGAAANLIADYQTFGGGTHNLAGTADYTLDFLKTLPGSDTAAITSGTTTVPEDAIYARVVATPRTVGFTFGAAFFSLTGRSPAPNTVGATAIAGFTQYACDITPLMFCLPSANYSASAHVGDMMLLRSGGNGAAWGPGDFGFLDPSKAKVDPNGPCAGLNGAQLDACLLGAQGSITQCFAQRGVDTEPGQKVGIEDASFNVRFDIYTAIMNGHKNNAAYAPAPNVIKGIVPNGGGGCIGGNPQPSPDTVGMPRDDCFATASCGGNGRFGDGNWSAGRTTYVTTNYGVGVTDPHQSATTRYQYYLAEIQAAAGGNILTGRAETGLPTCAPAASTDPDRRVLIAAAVNCDPAAGGTQINGQTSNVPVEEFFRMFLTEPVGTDGLSPPTLDLWVEIVGSAGGAGSGSGSSGGVFRDVVQLYR